MFSRICGKIWNNKQYYCGILKINMTTTSQLNQFNALSYKTKNDFARQGVNSSSTQKKFGNNNNNNDEQDQVQNKKSKKEDRILTRKEQVEALRNLTTEDRELSRDEIKSLSRQDQRDKQMSYNIVTEATLSDYDKNIDSLIEKRIDEGVSANDIVKEMLGLQTSAMKNKNNINGLSGMDENNYDEEEIKNALEDSKKYNILQSNPELSRQADEYKQFYDIIDQNRHKIEKLQLSDLPRKEQMKVNRKLTDSEKIEVESRAAAVGSYVASPFADRKNIPKEMLETRIFEQGDPDRLTYSQRQDLITEIQENAIDGVEEYKLERIKKKTILAQKLHAVEIDQNEDKRFRDLVEIDSKNTELQIEAPTDQEKKELKRFFSDPKRNTFLVQEKQLERAAKVLGINAHDPDDEEDYSVLKDISKEDIFIQKKLSEEDAEFQKKLERRKRLKEVRKFEESLNQNKYKSDIDYNDPDQNFKGEKVPKHEVYSDLPDLQKLKDLANKYNTMYEKDSHWDIHKKRSMKQVSDYIRSTLNTEKGNIQSIILFQNIQIDKISCNDAMTVIYVFWQIEKELTDAELAQLSLEEQAVYKYKNMIKRLHKDQDNQNKTNLQQKINKRLNKFSKFLSGMLCRELGFKYGPEIRFAISEKDNRQQELKKEISEVIPEIVKKNLMEKYEKGEIDQKINKAKMALDIDQKIIDLESKLEERMESDANLIALAKAKQKQSKNENKPDKKSLRNKNNKDEFGKKKKKKKAKKSEQFWDSLDAY